MENNKNFKFVPDILLVDDIIKKITGITLVKKTLNSFTLKVEVKDLELNEIMDYRDPLVIEPFIPDPDKSAKDIIVEVIEMCQKQTENYTMYITDYKSTIGNALIKGEWNHTSKEQIINTLIKKVAIALKFMDSTDKFTQFAKLGLDALKGRQRSGLNTEISIILRNIKPKNNYRILKNKTQFSDDEF